MVGKHISIRIQHFMKTYQNKKPFCYILFLNRMYESASQKVICIILKRISNSRSPMVNNGYASSVISPRSVEWNETMLKTYRCIFSSRGSLPWKQCVCNYHSGLQSGREKLKINSSIAKHGEQKN